jgi:hypothetical protein
MALQLVSLQPNSCLHNFLTSFFLHFPAIRLLLHAFPRMSIHLYIQGVSRLVDITAGGDFLGLCDQNISYKHVSDFGRLWNYGHFLIPVHALV